MSYYYISDKYEIFEQTFAFGSAYFLNTLHNCVITYTDKMKASTNF